MGKQTRVLQPVIRNRELPQGWTQANLDAIDMLQHVTMKPPIDTRDEAIASEPTSTSICSSPIHVLCPVERDPDSGSRQPKLPYGHAFSSEV